MYLRILAFLICIPLLAQGAGQVDKEAQAKAAADLRAGIETAPTLPFDGVRLQSKRPPSAGNLDWFLGWRLMA